MAGPRAKAIGRGRLSALLLLLPLAALPAFRAEASRTGVRESNPPAAFGLTKARPASALSSLAPTAGADIEAEEPPRFDLGDVVLVDTANADAEHFDLGPLTLVDLNLLRGPPPSYPETRVGGFELLPPFRVGASPSLSLWGRQACGFPCLGFASASPEDPWGLMEEMASYAGMATAGYSQEEVLQQAARDRAAAAAAGKAQLALIGAVNGAGWLSRTWAAVKETWQIGVGLKVADWLRFNQQNLSNLGQNVLEAVNPNPSPVAASLRNGAGQEAKLLAAAPERKLLTAAGETSLTEKQVERFSGTGYERGEALDRYLAQLRRGKGQVPTETQLGTRIHDVRVENTGTVTELAIEGKNYLRYRTVDGAVVEGRVPLSAQIQRQIYKDVLWIRAGKKQGLHRVAQWEFAGAPPNEELAGALERWGLPYVHPPKR